MRREQGLAGGFLLMRVLSFGLLTVGSFSLAAEDVLSQGPVRLPCLLFDIMNSQP